MKRILALLGFFPLVWTQDHDGAIRLRRAYIGIDGHWECRAIGWATVGLCPNGQVLYLYSRVGYVAKWKEWKHNRRHVVFSSSNSSAVFPASVENRWNKL